MLTLLRVLAATSRSRFFLSDADPASKQSILRAALGLFARHGLDGTTIRMIGEEAGYTNPAMFKFFPSKDALAVHLFERCYVRLHAAVAAAAAVEDFDAAFRAVIDALQAAMDEDLEAVLFVQDSFRELWPRLPARGRRHSMLASLRGLFERGILTGALTGFSSPDVPVAILLGSMAQLARMHYFGELTRSPSAWRADLDLALGRMTGTVQLRRSRPSRRKVKRP
jgi:AcrR family transcriptional regulator